MQRIASAHLRPKTKLDHDNPTDRDTESAITIPATTHPPGEHIDVAISRSAPHRIALLSRRSREPRRSTWDREIPDVSPTFSEPRPLPSPHGENRRLIEQRNTLRQPVGQALTRRTRRRHRRRLPGETSSSTIDIACDVAHHVPSSDIVHPRL